MSSTTTTTTRTRTRTMTITTATATATATLWMVLCLFLRASMIECCEVSLPRLVVKGNKFFDVITKEHVPIKGIAYYPRPNAGEYSMGQSRDFFSEEWRRVWERDLAHIRVLGVNAIRLYGVDPGLGHDSFMCACARAGIYVLIGLAASCEGCAITKEEAPDCYPAKLKARGQFIIRVFSRYDNVLGFSVANEANLFAPHDRPEVNAPCQKQFLRDMRAYVRRCHDEDEMTSFPIGIITADIKRDENTLYYGCRTDPSDELETTEWYGINTYLHCDGTATNIDELEGYKNLLEDFRRYNLSYPVMITEFGCVHESFQDVGAFESQRNFLQIQALFSSAYRRYFAGGFVFEYSTEMLNAPETPFPFYEYGEENYGLGYFTPEDCNDDNTTCHYVRFPQFATLASRYLSVTTSDELPLDLYEPGDDFVDQIPDCPSGFPNIADFAWPSEKEDDLPCPGEFSGLPGNSGYVPAAPPPTSSASNGKLFSSSRRRRRRRRRSSCGNATTTLLVAWGLAVAIAVGTLL